MTYAPPPPPPGPPPGPPTGGGFYYGPPPAAGAPAPHPAKSGGTAIIAVFIGALIGVVVLVGIIVLANQPAPPESCTQGVVCPPDPAPPSTGPRASQPPGQTLPPLTTPGPTPAGQTPGPSSTPAPTPLSNAAPYVAGTVWRSESLGYSFEYDSSTWTVTQEDTAYARLRLNSSRFNLTVHVVGFDGSVSVDSALQSIYEQTDTFVIGRATNTRPYDALLGPSIGYVRGKGGVFVGTYKDSDGNPSDPVGIAISGATNGKATVVVIVLVANPDDVIHGQTAQHELRHLADNLLKTFLWPQ